MTQSGSDPLDQRRRRIRYRCWHRGSREADLLLGHFADSSLAALDGDGLDQLEALLDQPDPDIWNWIIGREPVPPEFDHQIMGRLKLISNQLKST
ncbi:MAG: succinate dehydrogenase assembly factor 2 [Alphaproteobacteria bacterium]|jgi:antitoxin CptB|nr:succinate dehydrogenase assembly factor 2 [Alphaproteobacteria bacterium]MDP6515929.1 succinate dehydrogenase assembly factor 2 [Alphaproteobacteria bacterium]